MARYAQIAGGVVVAFLPGPPEQWADLHAAGALVLAGDDVRLGWLWDGAQFTAPATPSPPPVPTLEFRERFTDDERASITLRASRLMDDGDARLQVWLDDLNSATSVRLDSPKLALGMTYLVALGEITPERVAELLA